MPALPSLLMHARPPAEEEAAALDHGLWGLGPCRALAGSDIAIALHETLDAYRLHNFIRQAKLNLALGKSPRVWTGPQGPVSVGDESDGADHRHEAGGTSECRSSQDGAEAVDGAPAERQVSDSCRASSGIPPAESRSSAVRKPAVAGQGMRGSMLSARASARAVAAAAAAQRPVTGRQDPVWSRLDAHAQASLDAFQFQDPELASSYRAVTPLQMLQGKAVNLQIADAQGKANVDGWAPGTAASPAADSGSEDRVEYDCSSASPMKSPLRQWCALPPQSLE